MTSPHSAVIAAAAKASAHHPHPHPHPHPHQQHHKPTGLLQLHIPSSQHSPNNHQQQYQHTSPSSAAVMFFRSVATTTATDNHSHPHHPLQSSGPNSPKEEWFSLEGYLTMKCQSGALNFLQSKKRLYFGLDELENKLIYYRDKPDFDRRKECQGTIPLNGAMCSLIEGNMCAFILHTAGKKYIMEAENEQCSRCWLHALQQRRDSTQVDDPTSKGGGDMPIFVLSSFRRPRSRSRSLHSSESDTRTRNKEAVAVVGEKQVVVGESDSTTTATTTTTDGGLCIATPPPAMRAGRNGLKDLNRRASQPVALSHPHPQQQLLNAAAVESLCSLANSEGGLRKGLAVEPAPGLQAGWLENWIVSRWMSEQGSPPAGVGAGEGVVAAGSKPPPPEIAISLSPQTSPPHNNGNVLHLTHEASFTGGAAGGACSEPHSQLTSYCGSRRTSVTSSIGRLQRMDELQMLRMVDNRQKERIHELNAECNRLVEEVERLKGAVGR